MGTNGGTGVGGRLADKSYVIVALPKADDPVNSLSTDKKPHLTLLYLGPYLENPDRVAQFLRHAAANSLEEFFLTVKNRGPLGTDNADVLFFDKYRLKEIEDFRTHLRSNPDVEKSYLSTEQYPEWIPHLTLGYPETPYQSKKDEIFLPVVFDRLALWSGDSEGPEFPLRQSPDGMSHSDIDLEEEFSGFLDALEAELNLLDEEDLKHFGVKGMKWGVRKEERPALGSLGPSQIERKTASGKTIVMTKDTPNRLHRFLGRISSGYRESYKNSAALTLSDGSGKRIGEAQVRKKNKDELNLVWLGIDRSARGQGYATAAVKAAKEFGRQEGFKKLTLEVPGDSPDARHIYEKLGFKVDKVQPKQDDDDVWGGLTSMTLDVEKTVRHTDAEAFLAHYGVKGMKWGVVRKKPAPHTFSADASRAQKTKKKIERHGGIHALSNKEMQDLVTRANLEKQFKNLELLPPSTLDRAKKVVKFSSKAGTTMNNVLSFVNSPAGKVLRKTIFGL